MWVILYQALREFGLREVNEAKRAGNGGMAAHPLAAQFAATEAQVHKEALTAASRIAGLVRTVPHPRPGARSRRRRRRTSSRRAATSAWTRT